MSWKRWGIKFIGRTWDCGMIKIKRTIIGGFLLEIPRENVTIKADKLANKLKDTF